MIEVLSFLKMAHLHWHLTDDVSFALPVAALPDRLRPMCAPALSHNLDSLARERLGLGLVLGFGFGIGLVLGLGLGLS